LTKTTKAADKILKDNVGKFTDIVVIGYNEDGVISITSTEMSYPYVHWMLNKSIFEMNVHEKNSLIEKNAEKVAEQVVNAE